MLVDEGSEMQFLWGQLYATPAVAEKGYLDVEIKVETLGGHSSVPRESPAHSHHIIRSSDQKVHLLIRMQGKEMYMLTTV